jgi:Amt family ammonium transporter
MSESLASCVADLGEGASTSELFECVGASLDEVSAGAEASASLSNSFLLILSAALVFLMQAGFAMLCAGAVREKNVQNTLLKNLLDACGAAIAFFAVGYAFSFGGDDPDSSNKTFIGNANFFLIGVEDYGFWLFQYAFSAAAATIVAGTLAERCQMAAYLCYSVMLVGFVYPVIVHSLWSTQGFLSPSNIEPLWETGVIDFAGGGVVHLTGGMTALFATMILGPRRGRFHDEEGRPLERPKEFPGSSISLQMLGAFILWFGWYGFNAGSALNGTPNENRGSVAALAAANTGLSAGAGGLTALFVNLWILERYTGEPFFDLKYAMNGTLSGLVAITAGCGVVEPWAAVLIGFVAGLLYIGSSKGILRLRLDDAVDAIPVHLFNGAWGVLSVGFLASPERLLAAYGMDKHVGWFYSWSRGSGDATLLGAQIVAVLFIIGWTFVIMFPFFLALDWKGWFRADPLDEIVGLDLSYHGGNALTADSSVKPEYFKAYEERREKRRSSHRSSRRVSSSSMNTNMARNQLHNDSEEEDEEKDEEDVIEATEHADISDSQSSRRRESGKSVET